ncbi:MAG: HisA/HisF-related TIM barrel protein, partial [Candidatus Paceibacterota bacterium]
AALDIASVLGIPLVPKVNLLLCPTTVQAIAAHEACDAICISNTLPWGTLPEIIDWKGLFGSDVSPLAKYGGGGLSGAPLLPLLRGWLAEARDVVKKPIIAGGGILSADDVEAVSRQGVSAVALGTIAMLRPWSVADAIERAHDKFID